MSISVNDNLFNNLHNFEGFSINEKIYNYLGNLGFTGSIDDRLGKFESALGDKGLRGFIQDFGSWTPRQLFQGGQQGVFYHPRPVVSGQQILYQDAAGTTPVTSDGDPVGLMLDLHKGLVLGGNLISGAWTENGGWTEDGDVITAPGTSGSDSCTVDIATEVDKYYLVSIPNDMPTSGFYVEFVGQSGTQVGGLSANNDQVLIKAQSTSSTLRVGRWSGSPTGTIGPIVAQKLPGNHATQSTSAARPLYRTDGTLHWLEFDGADDFMIASEYSSEMVQPNVLAVSYRHLSGFRIVGRREGAGLGQLHYESSGSARWYAGEIVGSIGIFTGEDSVITGVFDGAGSKYRRNGSAYENIDSGTNSTLGPVIGADSDGGSAAGMLFYGLISCEGDRTPELDSVQIYLANLSGVTL